MTNSLTVLPAAVETVVKPKPTRAEVIDALTHLRIEQLTKERNAALAKAKSLKAKVEKAIIAAATRANLEPDNWYTYSESGMRCTLSLKVIPPALEALARESDAASRACRLSTDFKTVRKEVAADVQGTMDRTERVEALLKDPESVKALKAALAKIY